jgi:UDP-N-acetylmuramyl pentapeptide phosphotransferase/UDP-N-acetylglucosamine-1-phosphate transferase
MVPWHGPRSQQVCLQPGKGVSVSLVADDVGVSLVLVLLGGGSLASYQIVRVFRPWAEKRMLDLPNVRSSHRSPTPRGAGVAIVGVTLGVVWLSCAGGLLEMRWHRVIWFSLGGLGVAGVSWLDDAKGVSTLVRFLVHSVCAVALLVGVGWWSMIDLPFVGVVNLGRSGLLVSYLWVVGATNAYNFMDGIDGIAGQQGVVGGFVWIAIGAVTGDILCLTIGLALAASCLGFLVHNWPPAKIFMGDTGSAFLGYSFAALALSGWSSKPRLALAGAIVLWPFIADTGFTLLRRACQGENIIAAHRSHLYQRLVIAGHSHTTVNMVYLILGLLASGASVAWLSHLPGDRWVVVLVVMLTPLVLWRFVVFAEKRTGEASP